MNLKRVILAGLGACVLGVAGVVSANAMPKTPAAFDCHARMTDIGTVPLPKPGETHPWQCTSSARHKFTKALDWFRDSLEYCRIATTAYQDATRAAYRDAVRYGSKNWIVFLDADETVLDNSLYERERERCGETFSEASWQKWLKAGIARSVPGAAAFTQTVHALGGLVAIVTNRDASIDPVTRANLKTDGIWFDYETGRPHGTPHGKAARWRAAGASLAHSTGGAPKAVIWVGDQVTDFPHLDAQGHIVGAMNQGDAGQGIGQRFFLIPNPIYGNWTKNPEN